MQSIELNLNILFYLFNPDGMRKILHCLLPLLHFIRLLIAI